MKKNNTLAKAMAVHFFPRLKSWVNEKWKISIGFSHVKNMYQEAL